MANEAIQHVLQSDLPPAVQLLWVAYYTHESTTDAGMTTLTLQEMANLRCVNRSTICRQRQTLIEHGFMSESGRLLINGERVAHNATDPDRYAENDVAYSATKQPSAPPEGKSPDTGDEGHVVAYSATNREDGSPSPSSSSPSLQIGRAHV